MASSLLELAAKLSGTGMINPETQQFEPSGLYAIGIFAIAVVNVWINYALGAKRLHDRNRTAWWLVVQLLLLLGTVLLVVVAFVVPEEQRVPWFVAAGAVSVVALAVGLWLFVELGFLKGTDGPNRFGPDPLGKNQADATLG